MPILIFEYPSFTYAEAAPEEVAITEISEAPIAYLISTPNTRVNKGTITTPPPNPVSEPRNPALKEPSQIKTVNKVMSNYRNLRLIFIFKIIIEKLDALFVQKIYSSRC